MGDRAQINASYGGRQSGTDGEAIMASYGGGGVAGGGSPVPTFTTQPSITGTPTVGQPLSALTFTDPTVANGTISTRAYLLAGVSKALSYVLQAGDVGAQVAFQVTATGAGGSATATSSGVSVVAGATASIAHAGDSLSAQAGGGGRPRAYPLRYKDAANIPVFVVAADSRVIGTAADTNNHSINSAYGWLDDMLAATPSPRMAVLADGANDLQGSEAAYEANAASFIAALKAAGFTKIGWVFPAPLNPNATAPGYSTVMAGRATLLPKSRDPSFWRDQLGATFAIPLGHNPVFATSAAFFDHTHWVALGDNAAGACYAAAVDTNRDDSRLNSTAMYANAYPVDDATLATSTQYVRGFYVSGIAHGSLALSPGGNRIEVTGAEVRLNGGAWVSSITTGWLQNGDYIEIRFTSSANNLTNTPVTLLVGTGTKTINYTTVANVPAASYTHGSVDTFAAGSGVFPTVHTYTARNFSQTGLAVVTVQSGGSSPPNSVKVGSNTVTIPLYTQAGNYGGLNQSTFLVPVTAGARDIEITFAGVQRKSVVSWGVVLNAASSGATAGVRLDDDGSPLVTPTFTPAAKSVSLLFCGEYGTTVTPGTTNAGTTFIAENNIASDGDAVGVIVGLIAPGTNVFGSGNFGATSPTPVAYVNILAAGT